LHGRNGDEVEGQVEDPGLTGSTQKSPARRGAFSFVQEEDPTPSVLFASGPRERSRITVRPDPVRMLALTLTSPERVEAVLRVCVDGDEVVVVVWLCADGVEVCDCICDWAMAPNANAVVAASAIARVLILISECISPARSSRFPPLVQVVGDFSDLR
jgi:hypothetical protein